MKELISNSLQDEKIESLRILKQVGRMRLDLI